mmetsp:Transcript_22971/g.40013  ORF Transcript_22971/g.40013 Transcript_22971/m.40013 type:complete len:317 (-) Transcript_22971:554-1504(-)
MISSQHFPQKEGAVNEQLLLLLQHLIYPNVMGGANTRSASPHHCHQTTAPNLFDQLRSTTLSNSQEEGFSSWLNSWATSAHNVQINVPPIQNTAQFRSNKAGTALPEIPVPGGAGIISTCSPSSHVRGQDVDDLPFSLVTALETLSNGSLQKVLNFVQQLLQNRRVAWKQQLAHSAPISPFVLKALEEAAARTPTLKNLDKTSPDQMPGPDGAALASNIVKSDDNMSTTLELSATTNQNRPNHCIIGSGPWTVLEHEMFLKGLDEVGPGRWKDISLLVGTRTADQTRSHGQKYFKKLMRRKLPKKKFSQQTRGPKT